MKGMNGILIFVLVISLINVMTFLFVPSSAFNFSLQSFATEPWRFLTFQFFHVDVFHLIENLIGLVFIAFISMELEISLKNFLLAYFVSIFAVVLPIAFVFPSAVVAGNSTGIYGALSLCLLMSRKLVSTKITIPVIILFMFSFSILNFIICGICFIPFFKGEFFHFFGFLTGMTASFIPKREAKRLLRI